MKQSQIITLNTQGIYRKTDIHKFEISLGTQGLWEMKIIKDLNRRNKREAMCESVHD